MLELPAPFEFLVDNVFPFFQELVELLLLSLVLGLGHLGGAGCYTFLERGYKMIC